MLPGQPGGAGLTGLVFAANLHPLGATRYSVGGKRFVVR